MTGAAQQFASERSGSPLAIFAHAARLSGRDHQQRRAAVGARPSGLFPGWYCVGPGGLLAFQVGKLRCRATNCSTGSRPFLGSPRDRRRRPEAFDPAVYLRDLATLGCAVDAWETTHLHVLSGRDPVYRWMLGTGARPVLQALPEGPREQFVAEYQALLRAAYPARPYGTVLPYRRVYVVARRASPLAG
jgi:trans-aconitate 2-methyltransferase